MGRVRRAGFGCWAEAARLLFWEVLLEPPPPRLKEKDFMRDSARSALRDRGGALRSNFMVFFLGLKEESSKVTSPMRVAARSRQNVSLLLSVLDLALRRGCLRCLRKEPGDGLSLLEFSL